MNYKAVGFDWNGVVFGDPGSVFSNDVANLAGVTLAEYKRVYFNHNHLINKEGTSLKDFWAIVLKDLGVSDKLLDVLNYIKNKPKGKINEGVVDIIVKLKNTGLKLGLVSNETLEGGEKIRQMDVAKYFDVILISAEVGLMKPQKEMFELLINKLSINPGELIFVDDAEKSLVGATEIGFTPLLYTNPLDLAVKISELKAL
ncbi:MAG: HAD-IA family hydrolase [Nanoarchaeota archaeon]|nr:HAD-IA family hydrolase [Nanoarchaeota archaeon]